MTGCVLVALALTSHLTWTDRSTELAAARAEAEAVFDGMPDDATVFALDAPQPLALAGRASISRYLLFLGGAKHYVASQWADGIRGYLAWVRETEPTVVVTPLRGLVGSLRPFDRDYTEVEGGTDWRVFVRDDAPGNEPGPAQLP